MSWTILVGTLIGWGLLGLGMAYLFGRFISGVETPESADGTAPAVVSYLRRSKRAKAVARVRPAPQPKRRASGV